jgi:hypothetical protein
MRHASPTRSVASSATRVRPSTPGGRSSSCRSVPTSPSHAGGTSTACWQPEPDCPTPTWPPTRSPMESRRTRRRLSCSRYACCPMTRLWPSPTPRSGTVFRPTSCAALRSPYAGRGRPRSAGSPGWPTATPPIRSSPASDMWPWASRGSTSDRRSRSLGSRSDRTSSTRTWVWSSRRTPSSGTAIGLGSAATHARYNLMVINGWLVLRFAWEDVMFDQEYVRSVLAAVVRLVTGRAQPCCAHRCAA